MQKEDQKNKEKVFTLIREFDAPAKEVFNAFTDADALNAWWGPVESKNSVLKLDFRTGGIFHYEMKNNGKVNYGRFLFGKIQPYELLEFTNAFCDEHANIIRAPFDIQLPLEIFYRLLFTEKNDKTTISMTGYAVNATVEEQETFSSINADMQKGFNATFNQLEIYMHTRINIYKQLKTTNMTRVSTYLNFPGNTEEAFNFYKNIFNGEFTGDGLQRFGDTQLPEGMPPLSEDDRKLIIHAELTILGGHILMATDAPESMGLKVEYGNNMHINLEPATREETKKLYHALSAGGKITMELQDMFWGAYFGSCTDKYGINWMLNCIEKSSV
ncbi:MAG: SRPBCC domain-containing protein [Fimbriimonadaceae bacterium]|nr:SRPBCC domain-containing protein [Chitinophagales bacterium]